MSLPATDATNNEQNPLREELVSVTGPPCARLLIVIPVKGANRREIPPKPKCDQYTAGAETEVFAAEGTQRPGDTGGL